MEVFSGIGAGLVCFGCLVERSPCRCCWRWPRVMAVDFWKYLVTLEPREKYNFTFIGQPVDEIDAVPQLSSLLHVGVFAGCC